MGLDERELALHRLRNRRYYETKKEEIAFKTFYKRTMSGQFIPTQEKLDKYNNRLNEEDKQKIQDLINNRPSRLRDVPASAARRYKPYDQSDDVLLDDGPINIPDEEPDEVYYFNNDNNVDISQPIDELLDEPTRVDEDFQPDPPMSDGSDSDDDGGDDDGDIFTQQDLEEIDEAPTKKRGAAYSKREKAIQDKQKKLRGEFHINQARTAIGSNKSLMSNLNGLVRNLAGDDITPDLVELFKDADEVIKRIKELYRSTPGYIIFADRLNSAAPEFGRLIGDDALTIYRREFQTAKAAAKLTAVEKARRTKPIPFTELWKRYATINTNEYASQRHVLATLYTAGAYDDNSKLLFVPRGGYFKDVRLINNRTKMRIKDPNTYNIDDGRLILRSYKTANLYGAIDVILNKPTQGLIKQSLDAFPRKYLLSQKTNPNKPINAYSDEIKKIFGLTATDIRKIHITKRMKEIDLSNLTIQEKVELARQAAHSVDATMLYVHRGLQ